MVVDERSRHELYRRLEEVLGPDVATTLIEHLPPVGWADVATKHDLAGLEHWIDERFTRVDESIKAATADLRAAFEHELRTVEQGLRAQTTTFEQGLRTQTITMMFALVSVVLTMSALAFSLARFTS